MSRFLKMKSLIACVLIGTILSPLGAVAFTVSALENPPTRVVQFGDLDLNQDVGIAALYSRITSAVREVCEPLNVWSLRTFHEERDCREEALGRAVADVNSPALTTYFLTKHKATAPAID